MRFLRSRPWLLVVLVAALFLLADRGAYKNYFHPDDLDNIAWTSVVDSREFVDGFVSPRYSKWNFRPVGHSYFFILSRFAGLNFSPYVSVIQAIHILNIILVWLLTGSFGMRTMARLAAIVFFAFHSAVFDVYYRPMYIFDLLCATFCLLTICLWRKDKFWLSLLTFWCAYKSKELAILLPFVLMLLEFWFGSKRWWRLVPFFAISVNFGMQAFLLRDPNPTPYSLVFTSEAIGKTLAFYTPQIFIVPLLLVLPMFAVFRDKRSYFGLLLAFLLFFPMLFVPGRLYGAYLYLPLAGIALAIGALADRSNLAAHITLAVTCLAWLPYQYKLLRDYRNVTLAEGDENRAYVRGIRQISLVQPGVTLAVSESAPKNMAFWGTDGALHFIYKNPELKVIHMNQGVPENIPASGNMLLLSWDALKKRVNYVAHRAGEPEAPTIKMGVLTPVWQLEEGFFPVSGGFCWTSPKSRARLGRPKGAEMFEVTANIGPDYIKQVKQVTLTVRIDGETVGQRTFTKQGVQRTEWPVAKKPEETVKVEFEVDPPLKMEYADKKELGIPIVSFGYVP